MTCVFMLQFCAPMACLQLQYRTVGRASALMRFTCCSFLLLCDGHGSGVVHTVTDSGTVLLSQVAHLPLTSHCTPNGLISRSWLQHTRLHSTQPLTAAIHTSHFSRLSHSLTLTLVLPFSGHQKLIKQYKDVRVISLEVPKGKEGWIRIGMTAAGTWGNAGTPQLGPGLMGAELGECGRVASGCCK